MKRAAPRIQAKTLKRLFEDAQSSVLNELPFGYIVAEMERNMQQVTIKEGGKCFAIRSENKGLCGKIFQAVKVALPPTIREVS